MWWTLTIIAALVFMVLASSDTVYNLTSPPGPLQILMRKSNSILAFALLGYLFAQALRASDKQKSTVYVAAVIGAYSFLIEIEQAIVGSHEGLVWNTVDVICGAIGGYVGAGIQNILAFKRP